MSDIIRIPTVVILRSRDQRLRDKRPASDLEALLELQALSVRRGPPLPMRQIARAFGWSPGKLRRALERWQAEAQEAGDPALCPKVSPARETA